MADPQTKTRRSYPSDLTDEEWSAVKDVMPEPVWFENLQQPQHSAREMLNAIRFRTRTGIAWRSMPHDFPPWQTVARRYYTWRDEGVFDAMHDRLRDLVRIAEGRSRDPTAAILDSQSVKSTDVGGPRGFDAGKKGKGTKEAPARRCARVAPRRPRNSRLGTGP